ncbi:MAG TPA: hypothetical protein VF613_22615 [Longimicrobium sp.]|jgi:hypothetical protein
MRLRRFLVGVVPMLALAAGCSEMDRPRAGMAPPVAARVANETMLTLQHVETVAQYRELRTKPENLWAKAWIGPRGGTLEYYGFRIVVPAGAVDKVTMFTLSLPKEGTERALAEFGPHNVKFAQPITIELPYAGTTSEGYAAKALWYDESTKQWTDQGGTLSADGLRVQTQVWHFSTYGTAFMGGGTVSTSGG